MWQRKFLKKFENGLSWLIFERERERVKERGGSEERGSGFIQFSYHLMTSNGRSSKWLLVDTLKKKFFTVKKDSLQTKRHDQQQLNRG